MVTFAEAAEVLKEIKGRLPVVTKWDLIGDAEKASLEKTRFTNWAGDPGRCSGCGAELPTEAAFAQHYIVPDRRLFNIGYCPVKDAARWAPSPRGWEKVST